MKPQKKIKILTIMKLMPVVAVILSLPFIHYYLKNSDNSISFVYSILSTPMNVAFSIFSAIILSISIRPLKLTLKTGILYFLPQSGIMGRVFESFLYGVFLLPPLFYAKSIIEKFYIHFSGIPPFLFCQNWKVYAEFSLSIISANLLSFFFLILIFRKLRPVFFLVSILFLSEIFYLFHYPHPYSHLGVEHYWKITESKLYTYYSRHTAISSHIGWDIIEAWGSTQHLYRNKNGACQLEKVIEYSSAENTEFDSYEYSIENHGRDLYFVIYGMDSNHRGRHTQNMVKQILME